MISSYITRLLYLRSYVGRAVYGDMGYIWITNMFGDHILSESSINQLIGNVNPAEYAAMVEKPYRKNNFKEILNGNVGKMSKKILKK